MAFCKVCICGERIVFEHVLSFPDSCPTCGRKLVNFETYSEDDPRIKERVIGNENTDNYKNNETDYASKSEPHKKNYFLALNNGKIIEIPKEGGIVGRTEIGAEELAEFQSVSRQHLRVTPRRNVGVIVEDISTFGTLVDGERVEKYSPVRVTAGSRITLCNVDTILNIEEDGDL